MQDGSCDTFAEYGWSCLIGLYLPTFSSSIVQTMNDDDKHEFPIACPRNFLREYDSSRPYSRRKRIELLPFATHPPHALGEDQADGR